MRTRSPTMSRSTLGAWICASSRFRGSAAANPRGRRSSCSPNLLRPLLLELAQRIAVAPAQMIASGLLVEQVDEVAAAFTEQLGMRERRRSQSGEWAAVWLAAPG